MARPTHFRRRSSLAKEFRDCFRAGPRVWLIVGVTLAVSSLFAKVVWVALVLWLLFVLPAILGGLFSWAVSECIHWIQAARNLPRTDSPVNGAANRPIIEVRGRVIETLPKEAASGVGQPVGR